MKPSLRLELQQEPPMEFLSLTNALICTECECLTADPRICPRCGSSALMGIWRFIPSLLSTRLEAREDA